MASGREECTVGARSGQGTRQAHTRSSGDSIRNVIVQMGGRLTAQGQTLRRAA